MRTLYVAEYKCTHSLHIQNRKSAGPIVVQLDTGQNGDKSKRRQPKRRQGNTATIVVKTATTIGQNGDNHWSIATNIVYVKTATNLNGDNGTATNQINEDDNCNFIRLMNCINIILILYVVGITIGNKNAIMISYPN